MPNRQWVKASRPVTPADVFITVLLGAGLALFIILMLFGCAPPDAEHYDQAQRIIKISEDGYTSVFKDKKTGCEFLHSRNWGYGEGVVSIPGTCKP